MIAGLVLYGYTGAGAILFQNLMQARFAMGDEALYQPPAACFPGLREFLDGERGIRGCHQ
ncbi:MAG TPA: hypothetical protein VFK15_05320 [Burkholderiales bacterium]|nr:hypothetical protein [Burkholderiales bacterium]